MEKYIQSTDNSKKITVHFYHPKLISKTYHLNENQLLSQIRSVISRQTLLRMFLNYSFTYNKKAVAETIPIRQALNINQNTKEKVFNLQIKLTFFDQRCSKHHLKQVVEILYNPVLYQLYQTYSFEENNALLEEITTKTSNLQSSILMPKQNHQISSNINNILDYNVSNQLILPQLKNQKPELFQFLSYSGYNPPPPSQKLQGTLFYLYLRVLQGGDYHITACCEGFYINQSKISNFNPIPMPGKPVFVSLIDLIKNVSQKFNSRFEQFLSQNQLDETDKYYMSQKNTKATSWLQKCQFQHSWNSKKSMNLYLKESFDVRLQDWNQFFHTVDQLVMKRSFDELTKYDTLKRFYQQFQQAAVEGATMIIDGKLAPLNPLEQRKKHIYIYNRIFFSLTTQTTYNHAQEKGEQAAPSSSAINSDLINLNVLYNLKIPGISVLHMIIINYRGFRIIAQSIIPGILSPDQSLCSQYGSIDDGKTIQTNPQFQKIMIQIAQKLHLDDNINVLDGKGCKKKIAISPDIKGILGSNNKKYILDLLRLSPRDLNYPEIQNETCVLRHQLIELYKKVKFVEQKSLEDFPKMNVNIATQIKYIPNENTQKQQKSLQQMASFIYTNAIPNLINCLKNNGSQYLTDCQGISKAFHNNGVNLRYLGIVYDHSELKDFLNIKIVLQRIILTKSLKHLFRMVMRQSSILHMSTVLSYLLNCLFGKSSHILQLEDGTIKQVEQQVSKQNRKKKKKANKMKQINSNVIDFNNLTQTQNVIKIQPPVYLSMRPSELWNVVKKISQARYKHKLSDNLIQLNQKGIFSLPYTKLATLQDLCNTIGLTLQQKNYSIIDEEGSQVNNLKNSSTTSTNYQNNYHSQNNGTSSLPFNAKNIVGIYPCSKKINLKIPYEQDLIKIAQNEMQNFKIKQSIDHFKELQYIYTQVNNIEGICQMCSKIAKIYYMMVQYQAALNRQLIPLKLYEAGLRKNSFKVIQSYSKLGLYQMVIGNKTRALYFLHKSLFLMLINFGQTYPDILVTIANIARMYQQDKQIQSAQKCYLKAIDILRPSNTKHHINISFCYSCLASLHYQSADYKKAIQYQTEAVVLISQILSQQDSRLIDAKKILKMYIDMAQKGKLYTPQQVPSSNSVMKEKQKSERYKK